MAFLSLTQYATVSRMVISLSLSLGYWIPPSFVGFPLTLYAAAESHTGQVGQNQTKRLIFHADVKATSKWNLEMSKSISLGWDFMEFS